MNEPLARNATQSWFRLLRRPKLWVALLFASSIGCVLLIAQRNIDTAQGRLELRAARERDNIVANATVARRRLPSSNVGCRSRISGPARGGDVMERASKVASAARAYSEGSVLAVTDREQVRRLVDAVTTWSEVIKSIVATLAGQQALSRLNAKFKDIDKECSAILALTETAAKVDDREAVKLNEQEVLLHYAGVALILTLIASVMILQTKSRVAAQIHRSEKAVLETTRKIRAAARA